MNFLQDPLSPITVSSPPPCRFGVQIIGAEDDCFDSDQEQVCLFHTVTLTFVVFIIPSKFQHC